MRRVGPAWGSSQDVVDELDQVIKVADLGLTRRVGKVRLGLWDLIIS